MFNTCILHANEPFCGGLSFFLLSIVVSISGGGIKLLLSVIIFSDSLIECHLAGGFPLLLYLIVNIFKVLYKLLILASDVLSFPQKRLITKHLQTFLTLIKDVQDLISLI
jgi:hypothetical protein